MIFFVFREYILMNNKRGVENDFATPFLLKRVIRFARLFVQGFYFEQDRLIVCFICFVGRGDSIFQ